MLLHFLYSKNVLYYLHMEKRGGYREGAGRPKGSLNQPKFLDYIVTKDVEHFVQLAIKHANAGDSSMIKFILDQTFGRARQNIGLDGGADGSPLEILISEAIADKRNIDYTIKDIAETIKKDLPPPSQE